MNFKNLSFATIALVCVVFLCGCLGWNPFNPKVESPISHQPVDAAQLTAELHDVETKAELAQKTADRKFQRAVKSIQAQAEADIQNATDEYGDDAAQRTASIESIRAAVSNCQTEITNRKTFVSDVFSFATDLGKSSGIPGVALISSLALAVGHKIGSSSQKIETEKAASAAHDDAWEESKKETMAWIGTLIGRGPPAPAALSISPPPVPLP